MLKTEITAYEFGPFRLDTAGRQLLRDGQPVPLTAKLFDILLLLVQNRGRVVVKETLMREIWSDSFVEENNLTVSISVLRKILGERHREHEYIETVTKRGYRFVARVRQVQGWNASHAGAAEDVRAAGERQEPSAALAVLPFVNGSGDPGLEHLADGITENIIFNLSRFPQLRVMARSTVFRYKGRDADALQIGRELGVQKVLVGRVSQLEGRLLLSVEVVDVSDGSQLWGEQYNGPLSDVTTAQYEIAAEITERLRQRMAGEEPRQLTVGHTHNADACQSYLKGRYFWNKRDIARAVEYFEEAIRLDARYAPAYAGLADCRVSLVYVNALPVADALPEIKRLAVKALALDETLDEAHSSLGYVELMSLNWARAESAYRRALELNPRSALARSRYSFLLDVQGRAEEAVAQMEQALAIAPLSPLLRVNAARIFYHARRYERALEQCREALEIEPHFATAHAMLGLIYERQAAYEEAASELRKAIGLLADDTEALSILGYVYAAAGKRREARQVLNKLLRLSGRRYVSSFFLACVYAGLGEKEKVFECLDKAYDELSYIQTLAVCPFFDELRSEPHFAELLRRTGLPSTA